jgi:kumamolisin
MERAFQVKLIRYKHERGNYRGRRGPLQIPKTLEGIVVGVFGLDNRRVVKERRGTARLGSLAAMAQAKHRTWFFPAELASLYKFPAGDGSGQSIGILEFGGGFFPDDLAAFCRQAGVPEPNVVPISIDNSATDQHDGSEAEVMLDIEVVAGICPKATIPVYFSQFTEQGWIDALDAAIHDTDSTPSVLSVSWGDAEDNASWTDQAIEQVNEAFKEAALAGITVCVASGDDGSDDQVGDGHAHVDFPASSPFVLAVGGTILHNQNNEMLEMGWKDGDGLRKDGGGSSCGGVSVVFDPPSWQQSFEVESVNPGAKPGRCVPDVAADASVHSGYFMVVDGKAGPNGGTSAAAPLWASFISRINAVLGKRVGYLTPILYQTKAGTLGCQDIVTGDNATATVGGYSAKKGYDCVTGWGSPAGDKLLQALKTVI